MPIQIALHVRVPNRERLKNEEKNSDVFLFGGWVGLPKRPIISHFFGRFWRDGWMG